VKRYSSFFVFVFTIVFISIWSTESIYAQEKNTNSDSTAVKIHSPKKATYLALVPGLGQIYNRKYWKLPIVYAGFAVTGYLGVTNRNEFLIYNEAYTCSVNEGEDCENELTDKYTSDELKSIKDYYQRNMELSFIIMGVWYILQILDASVDAHLYSWEVDDNLNVNIQPVAQPPIRGLQIPGQEMPFNGLKISVNF